jgi:ABC-2 type transport system ATP-binding protein
VSDPVIALRGVGKRYTKYEDQPSLVTSLAHIGRRSRRHKLWALRNVDLEVGSGECVGVIGRNGSGKSTMLQMLAGVTMPTEGRVRVRGRIAPLVAVGVGFHPELTGRENVYLNGTILGLTRPQIEERFEDIVAFAEVADFIDTPVKFYSSGMFVRLGFSVAIHTEPDILLVDEVLAVGDFAFQMKCFDRMQQIREKGTTVLVVTHNLNSVRAMCDRVALLHRGQLIYTGEPGEAISRYHTIMGEQRELERELDTTSGTWSPGVASIDSLEVLRPDGAETGMVSTGDDLLVRVEGTVLAAMRDPVLGVAVTAANGALAYADTSFGRPSGEFAAGDRFTGEVRIKAKLVTGSFSLVVTLRSSNLDTLYDRAGPRTFWVGGRRLATGISDMEADFRLQRLPGSGVATAATEAAGT